MLPLCMPRLNQLTRCALLPCVKLSGTTVPCDLRCSVSSPICAAALSASSTSPCSGSGARAARGAPTRRRNNRPAVPCAPTAHSPEPRRCGRACASTFSVMPSQVLHVVSHLVGDHVGLREVARRAQARAHAFRRTADRCRPCGRPGNKTAPSPPGQCRTRSAWRRETAPASAPVGRPARRTSLSTRPRCRPARWTRRRHLVVGRRALRRPLASHRCLGHAAVQHAEQRERVDAEDPARDQRDHDGAQPDAAAATDAKAAAAHRALRRAGPRRCRSAGCLPIA